MQHIEGFCILLRLEVTTSELPLLVKSEMVDDQVDNASARVEQNDPESASCLDDIVLLLQSKECYQS